MNVRGCCFRASSGRGAARDAVLSEPRITQLTLLLLLAVAVIALSQRVSSYDVMLLIHWWVFFWQSFVRRLECYQCCAPRAGDAQRVSSEPDGPSCILKVSGLEPQTRYRLC